MGTTNMHNVLPFHKESRRSGAKLELADPGRQYPASGQMSAFTTIVIITLLVGFAVLHVIGAMLMVNLSDRPAAGLPPIYQGD